MICIRNGGRYQMDIFEPVNFTRCSDIPQPNVTFNTRFRIRIEGRMSKVPLTSTRPQKERRIVTFVPPTIADPIQERTNNERTENRKSISLSYRSAPPARLFFCCSCSLLFSLASEIAFFFPANPVKESPTTMRAPPSMRELYAVAVGMAKEARGDEVWGV